MLFDYRQSVPLASVPVVAAAALREKILARVAEGWRLLALFGLPEADGAGLCCVLANDAEATLAAMRTPPLTSWPALTPDCPQAHLFERELFEQWRITPVGHPWLKPVRFAPALVPGADARPLPGDIAFHQVRGSQVHEVAVGPVHAGIIEPGHFRFQCHGENVLFLEISLGFQHRGIEKLLIDGPDRRTPHLLECAAGDSSIAHATAHAVLLERLAGIEAPRRARLTRRIALELERLANHTGDLGAIAGDTGFLPTAAWNGRIRGDFLNLTAALCGNRFGRGLVCPGGVAVTVPPELCGLLKPRLNAAWRDARGAVDTMLAAPSVQARLTRTGTVPRDTAARLGLVGVAGRASGLPQDARFAFPVDALPADLLTLRTQTTGDVLARTLVRNAELDDAAAQALEDLDHLSRTAPKDPWATALPPLPAGRLSVAQVEGWRGEVCHVAVTDERGAFRAYKVIDPSFHNWAGLAMALRDEQISDFPLCNKSFNLSYCGHDL